MSRRKAYVPLSDEHLDRLKATVRPLHVTKLARVTLPAKTLYNLVMEVIDLREEIFRLQLCETVDEIIAQELAGAETEEEILALKWPDPFLLSEMLSAVQVTGPTCETTKLPRQTEPTEPSPGGEGRRMPRFG